MCNQTLTSLNYNSTLESALEICLDGKTMQLSEKLSNVIENLACRLAQANGGTITPHYILPYIPLSLGIVEECLNNMVDGSSITSSVEDNLTTFSFAAYKNGENMPTPALLTFDRCVACDSDFPQSDSHAAICGKCFTSIQPELNKLAEQMAWPAQAVYEHEILYNASKEKIAMHPAQLAAVSRFTLRSITRKLNHLADNRFAIKEEQPANGISTYQFPPVSYPRDLYRTNMSVILTYPASIMEEVQLKITRIFMALGLMLAIMLGLAFWGFPFPMLVMLFFIAAPITAFSIWRRKSAPNDD